MADDFERVANWWDRGCLLTEKRAVLALCGADLALAERDWSELEGTLRWRLVSSIRYLIRLAGELRDLVER